RMPFDLAPFGPFVGVVMMIDVDEQQAGLRAVDDQPDVGVHSDRPEIRILSAVQLVEGKSRRGGVELQIEGGGFRRLLLLRRQAREALGEGVGDPEFHQDCSRAQTAANSSAVMAIALNLWGASASGLTNDASVPLKLKYSPTVGMVFA